LLGHRSPQSHARRRRFSERDRARLGRSRGRPGLRAAPAGGVGWRPVL